MRTYKCQNHYEGCDAVFTNNDAICPECGKQNYYRTPNPVIVNPDTYEPVSWPTHYAPYTAEDEHDHWIRCSIHSTTFRSFDRCHWCTTHPDEIYYVNVYSVGRAYGGPEEGGWWFDTGEPVTTEKGNISLKLHDFRQAQTIQKVLLEQYEDTGKSGSVLGGEDFRVTIENHPARPYPRVRPHYC